MIGSDELAAISAALAALAGEESAPPEPLTPRSRWKIAARNPELEIEELRAVR